ncbi:MAG: hypothetical protein RLZZ148_1534 [Cyanobacteriota bacterium]|jgi:predicted transcriptional regulator
MTVKVNSTRDSVSLTVYRELIKELQTSQDRIEALDAQNQELVKQNKQLRQALENMLLAPPDPTSAEMPIREKVTEEITYSIGEGEKFLPDSIADTKSKPKISGTLVGVVVFVIVVTFGLGAFWSIRSIVKR